ncbi:uncharacterized protein LOC119709128 isoform X2 [Motacilla alba alba]|uniref:uncharacterized protein LOC119709128 isoform X2 n=1 Tax=Motacilla alba alba TaxID=1094192 RepID=UPI0018D4DAF5|nr:uncharacterized protein LOC119709128 isoform X2 [Motacilla alba alba]
MQLWAEGVEYQERQAWSTQPCPGSCCDTWQTPGILRACLRPLPRHATLCGWGEERREDEEDGERTGAALGARWRFAVLQLLADTFAHTPHSFPPCQRSACIRVRAHPYNCPGPGWMGIRAACSGGRCLSHWQGGWNWVIFNVPSKPSRAGLPGLAACPAVPGGWRSCHTCGGMRERAPARAGSPACHRRLRRRSPHPAAAPASPQNQRGSGSRPSSREPPRREG